MFIVPWYVGGNYIRSIRWNAFSIKYIGNASRSDLVADPDLPDDTRLWAALQAVSGGTWGGCVYDVDSIASQLL